MNNILQIDQKIIIIIITWHYSLSPVKIMLWRELQLKASNTIKPFTYCLIKNRARLYYEFQKISAIRSLTVIVFSFAILFCCVKNLNIFKFYLIEDIKILATRFFFQRKKMVYHTTMMMTWNVQELITSNKN